MRFNKKTRIALALLIDKTLSELPRGELERYLLAEAEVRDKLDAAIKRLINRNLKGQVKQLDNKQTFT